MQIIKSCPVKKEVSLPTIPPTVIKTKMRLKFLGSMLNVFPISTRIGLRDIKNDDNTKKER